MATSVVGKLRILDLSVLAGRGLAHFSRRGNQQTSDAEKDGPNPIGRPSNSYKYLDRKGKPLRLPQ